MLLCSHFSVQAELLCLDSFVPGLGPEPSSEFDLGAHSVFVPRAPASMGAGLSGGVLLLLMGSL